ncbi:PREDICTED: serine palmitoyltransferase small subunit B isoform X2 [Gekko japonicus]|nr:PREDICTED: serine palmitoyltransferase small subunit B isoform X2 [Gekko japonicus]XP_015262734.1 PREDICTED: serine palmitoyltransferase small subunit B isoform X2 [Gekko japonicus]XP_015262735.1 PREDICTED: serine palmitoyltransferase small subunit B isoform X2 [Gekko japonicus]
MDLKRVKDYIYWLYYQYLLISCSYVLEPWEQSMFNTVIITVVGMVVYTAYVFIPIHVRLAFEFFSQMFGSQPESTASLMN